MLNKYSVMFSDYKGWLIELKLITFQPSPLPT